MTATRRRTGRTCSQPCVRRRPSVGGVRTGAPGVARRRADHHRADQPHQRPRRLRRGGRARPRRLPRRPRPGHPRGDDVPGRPPAAPAPPGHRHAVGPAAAAGAAARPRRAGRGARRRPAVHRAGDRGVLRRDGAPAVRRRGQPPWKAGRRAGSPRCSSRPCRCRGGRTSAGFIDGFAGDDRHVVDYLVEEVVHRQPEDVRDFLLRTSVLPRLSGPLADAVTGRTDGRAMLEALDRDNLFLVPLDDQRRWYRYHHLFADMLQARLLDELPGEAPELHRRASAWHEQDGDTTAAIEHALAAGDVERAAGLVEAALPADDQGTARGPAAPLDGGTSRRGLRASSRARERLRRRLDVHRRDPRVSSRGCASPSSGWRRPERCPQASLPAGLLVAHPATVAAAPRLGQDPPRRAGPDGRRRGRHHGPRPGGARGARPRTTTWVTVPPPP